MILKNGCDIWRNATTGPSAANAAALAMFVCICVCACVRVRLSIGDKKANAINAIKCRLTTNECCATVR